MSYIKRFSRLLLLVSLLYMGSCTMEWEESGGDNTPTEQPNTPNEGDNYAENENEEENNNEDNTPSDGDNSEDENNGNNETTPPSGDENENGDESNEEGDDDEGGYSGEPAPDADLSITAWNGEWATDVGNDTVGTDKDFFYELNTFNNTVVVTYNGSTASVASNLCIPGRTDTYKEKPLNPPSFLASSFIMLLFFSQ